MDKNNIKDTIFLSFDTRDGLCSEMISYAFPSVTTP